MKIFSERSETEDFDEEAYQKSKRGERRQAYIFLILGHDNTNSYGELVIKERL